MAGVLMRRAMVKYLGRFFQVNVYPASEPKKRQGSLMLPSGHVHWKHMKPLRNTVLDIHDAVEPDRTLRHSFHLAARLLQLDASARADMSTRGAFRQEPGWQEHRFCVFGGVLLRAQQY